MARLASVADIRACRLSVRTWAERGGGQLHNKRRLRGASWGNRGMIGGPVRGTHWRKCAKPWLPRTLGNSRVLSDFWFKYAFFRLR